MTQNQMPVIQKGYLHIGFNFAGPVKDTAIEPVFTALADDWIRYAPNCWLAWTKHNQAVWIEAIKPHLGTYDHVIILEVKQQQFLNGWLPDWIWNWLFKVRT